MKIPRSLLIQEDEKKEPQIKISHVPGRALKSAFRGQRYKSPVNYCHGAVQARRKICRIDHSLADGISSAIGASVAVISYPSCRSRAGIVAAYAIDSAT